MVTASSHSTSVTTVDAANTTAYCCRNDALVKSTSVVPSIAPDNFRTTHTAACAHPFASAPNGSVTVPTVPLPGRDAPPPGLSTHRIPLPEMGRSGQFALGVPDGDGDGLPVGDGSAKTR